MILRWLERCKLARATWLKLSQTNAVKYQQRLTAQQNLNKQYQPLHDNYSTTLNQFDDLVGKYRKLAMRSNPRNKLDLGLGVLKPTAGGEDPHYFAMIGSGVALMYTEFHGWVLMGNNSYAMVGMSF